MIVAVKILFYERGFCLTDIRVKKRDNKAQLRSIA